MSKIFFSWQADRPGKAGRHLVHGALEDAINMIRADADVEDADRDEIHVDSDTRGVAGTPPVFDTILKKIDAAAAFVADVTFVSDRSGNRRAPNPNVMIEYGWALKAVTWQRVIGVMNTAYGDPSDFELPFDLSHMRRPITYCCSEDADAGTIKAERKKLAFAFKTAIDLILALEAPSPAPLPEYVPIEPAVGKAWFTPIDEPLGVLHDGSPISSAPSPVRLAKGPVMWLRVLPKFDPGKPILNTDLRTGLMNNGNVVLPLNARNQGGNPYGIRGADGYGLGVNVSNGQTFSVVYAFARGEIWSIDALYLMAVKDKIIFSIEQHTQALVAYAALLDRLGIVGPYCWKAGLDGIQGRVLQPAEHQYVFAPPASVANSVERQGDFSGRPEDAAQALEAYFEAVFDLGHLKRPR